MTPHTFCSLLVCATLAIPAAFAAGPPTVRDHAVAEGTVTAQAEIPCPVVKVAARPPAPAGMPVRDRSRPTIGGDGLATAGLAVPAGTAQPPGNLSATSWVVADLDSGAIIGACGPHEYGAPASLQKLLLAATVMAKLTPDAKVTITKEDLNFEAGSSAVGLVLGGTYSVETIWLGLLLNSGNDAANTLARLGGGDRGVRGTIADMNAEARRLGAEDTRAETPSGLDGPGQVTSAYDLALIARACFERPDFRRYAATRSAQMPAQPPKSPKGYQIQNDNNLLFEYPGAMGGKTGFTDIARHTFMGAAERDGRHLVVTMLGAEHQPMRTWQQGAALLDWGFAAPPGASVGRLVRPGEADRRPAANATASANALVRAASIGTPPARTAVIVGAAIAFAVFLGVWLAAAGALRRRRGRNSRRDEPPSRPTVSASDVGR